MKSTQSILLFLLLIAGLIACQQGYFYYQRLTYNAAFAGGMSAASFLPSYPSQEDSCSEESVVVSIADSSETTFLQTDSLLENSEGALEKTLKVSENGIFRQTNFEVEECEVLTDIKASKEELSDALKQHKRCLKRESKRKKYSFDGIERTNLQLRTTIDQLQEWLAKEDGEASLCELFDTYQLKGKNENGRVKTTAYYTPVIEGSRTWSKTFQYPIYRKPDASVWQGELPTRQEIDGDMKLVGRDLEVAWTKSLLDNYFMNLQGSAYVEYQDSVRELLLYDGQNGHPYRGVQNYLVSQRYVSSVGVDMQNVKHWFKENPDSIRPILFRNPSYTFFKKSPKSPTGAAGVELTAKHSVAVDIRYIPYGAVLLAKLPRKGRHQKAEWRILLPQDKGGAIRGDAHLDLYCGVGEAAVREAQSMKTYSEVWLLLAKE
ncbi:MAG: MltA domain-containing protein [Chitinophagales bacterium]